MNEYLDTPDDNVYDAINQVRKRARIPQLNKRMNLTQKEMRARIHNERRVELAFEEHRFWDVRRWDETSIFNAPVHGVRITIDGDKTNYEYFEVENRVFDSKLKYYPIPQKEIQKNPALKQNAGW